MPILEILKYGDNRLKEKSEIVEEFTDEIKTLIQDMTETLKVTGGVGLAAPQVGVLKRLFIYNMGDETEITHALINPKIIKKAGTDEWYEGCLSVPGIQGKVKRALRVMVTGINENGEEVSIKATEYLARCFQHEIDHLDGIIFMDIADPNTLEPTESFEEKENFSKVNK